MLKILDRRGITARNNRHDFYIDSVMGSFF